MSANVVLADHPWPDVDIERAILSAAGYELFAGPIETPDAAYVESLVAKHDPIAIMTCWARVSATAIGYPRALKIVARMGIGLDNIDLAAATERGAWVTNVPGYCVEEASDHTVAMLLALWRGLPVMDRDVKAGSWNPAAAMLTRVSTRTIGIIGYGSIGQATARKLSQGFGCKVLVNSPSLLRQHAVGHQLAPQLFVADIATLQREADAIAFHTPLTGQTRHMADDGFFAKLERKPLLVNVSRGGLIDNDALVRALDSGKISGAGLDVVEGEPTPPRSIADRKDIIVTPHVAFSSETSLLELRQRSADEVVRVLKGELPLHPCNSP
jgi:D-3-phosphoglycerate dehydrogenase